MSLKRTEPVTLAFFGSRPIVAIAVTDLPDPDSPDDAENLAGGEVGARPLVRRGRVPSLVGKSTYRFSIFRTGPGIQARTRVFFGSNASRRPSPIKKTERMSTTRNAAGKANSHHWVVAESWAVGNQETERDVGRLDAEPEERQGRLEDDRQRHGQSRVDDDGRYCVRHQVSHDYAGVRWRREHARLRRNLAL